jgi:hypothetical protein
MGGIVLMAWAAAPPGVSSDCDRASFALSLNFQYSNFLVVSNAFS